VLFFQFTPKDYVILDLLMRLTLSYERVSFYRVPLKSEIYNISIISAQLTVSAKTCSW